MQIVDTCARYSAAINDLIEWVSTVTSVNQMLTSQNQCLS